MGCGGTGALSEVRISPYTDTVALSDTQQFTATGYDAGGHPITVDATWSIFGSLGTIDAEGLFYAGVQTGTTYVVATVSGISGQAAVTITDKGSISGKVKNNLGSPINGITVRLASQTSKSDETNSEGSYALSDLSEATYTVETVGTIRYLSSSGEAVVTMAQGTTLNFTLNERIAIITSNATRVGTIMNIAGTVKNNGTTDATGCSVVYAYYDEEDFPMGNGASTVGTINAGSTEAFIMSVNLTEDKDSSRTVSYGVASGF